MILVCGATGDLGARIARRLRASGSPVRALVRPQTDAGPLRELGIDVAIGDFRDPPSLARAVAGADTVVSTVTAIGRALAGERGASLHHVDLVGHRHLAAAAEDAGVQRFVFISAAGFRREPGAGTALGRGKNATEDLLAGSTLQEVIVRPDQFQEVWLSPIVQFDWPARKVVIFGRGEMPTRYVSTEDVAAAVVRLTLESDPPRMIEFGGPDPLTRKQAVGVFERALGEPIRRRHVPRVALHAGSTVLRRVRPALSSVMGGALHADTRAPTWDDGPLRELGIEPRGVEAYAEEVTRPL